MSNTFFQGGGKFSRGASPPAPPLVTGLIAIVAQQQNKYVMKDRKRTT